MGIVRAAAGAIGGSLADSWLDFIEADNMTDTTAMTRGVQVHDRRSSNRRQSTGIVSNGSKVIVGQNQMMLLVDGGNIVDYCAEPGYYEVFMSSAPSMFNGEFKDSLKDTWNRFKFGGQPSSKQEIYFINLQEIKNIKFGTRNALNYFDSFYNSELFIRCHGTYSIKITDPIKFFKEACPRNAQRVDMNNIGEQYLMEFTQALQTSIAKMSMDGKRISYLNAMTLDLARYMQNALDDQWKELRGMEICSVAIAPISYDDESKKLIERRNQAGILSDPSIRDTYIQTTVADGLGRAGSNSSGAMNGYVGMGMGMNVAGGFMQSVASANAQQRQQNQSANANSWNCSCGTSNTGKFCQNCGKAKPAPAGSWTCQCGTVNTGNFCQNCGNRKPVQSGNWTCQCGAVNTGNFCQSCGNRKP